MLVHKGGHIKNLSGECRDVIPIKLQCQAIQRALQSLLYQLTKFEAPSCYSFRDIMNTNFHSPNLQREIIQKKIK